MRKKKPFTPERLMRWRNQGRGTGTQSSYTPWHQVTRDDPSSRGRSHLVPWHRFNRLHHLLSDLELVGMAFGSMLPDLEDLREQFPLATKSSRHELLAYQTAGMPEFLPHCPGSLALASDLNIAHPVVRGEAGIAPWVLTTDLLITRRVANRQRQLLAVSLKYLDETLNSRQLDLLRLEREYWTRRGVRWLFITPRVFHPSVARALRLGMPWAMGQSPVPAEVIAYCAAHATSWHLLSQLQVLCRLAERLRVSMHDAQCVFWQSVWAGALPIDLTWAGRISDSVRILDPDEFWSQNPIVSGRSAWLH